MSKKPLHEVPPRRLSHARDLAHKAVQLVTKAARANLAPIPDDSHSNLGWVADRQAFKSHALTTENGKHHICFGIQDFTLYLVDDGTETATRQLSGDDERQAVDWLDKQLVARGLQPVGSIDLPYALPDGAKDINTFALDGHHEALSVLAAWYSVANTVISRIVQANRYLQPGPSAVRCWPHHFDLGTYVALEQGDAEEARGIGIGLSPGDESYDEPYVYVNPWPHLDPETLPVLPPPGHWHTQGFVGAIATATEILTLDDIDRDLTRFIDEALKTGRKGLGA
jgi:hypothetical protein